MKSLALASVLALSVSAVACAAPSGDVEEQSEVSESAANDLTSSSQSASEGKSLMRGEFSANGERFTLEVELTSKQNVQQMKYCEPWDSLDDYAGAAASVNYQEIGGSIRTIVRNAEGKIIGEASDTFGAFAAYARLDVSAHCTKSGKIKNREPSLHFENVNPLITVPGVIAETSKGPIWINPSYGGVARAFVNFDGSTDYQPLSRNADATLHPRPFGGSGQELHFGKGTMTFKPGEKIVLEVGTDIQGGSFGHAKHVEEIELKRQ
jgi:hypothetical protein